MVDSISETPALTALALMACSSNDLLLDASTWFGIDMASLQGTGCWGTLFCLSITIFKGYACAVEAHPSLFVALFRLKRQ